MRIKKPSPTRGRRHGGAVTDEVGQLRPRGAVRLISRLRRQLPLIGEAMDVRPSSLPWQGRWHGGAVTERFRHRSNVTKEMIFIILF